MTGQIIVTGTEDKKVVQILIVGPEPMEVSDLKLAISKWLNTLEDGSSNAQTEPSGDSDNYCGAV